jgi:hypothetical protein
MSKQTWSQDTIGRRAAAVLLAAAMLAPTAAGAHPIGGSSTRGAAHQIGSFGIPDEGPQVEELDPTDDGFIIIECVGCGSGRSQRKRAARWLLDANGGRAAVPAWSFDMLAPRA